MAVWVVVQSSSLSPGIILAPERYHPGRTMELAHRAFAQVADVALLSRETVSPAAGSRAENRYLVLDTSDVADGYMRPRKASVGGTEIGSTKRSVRPGDVVVSRLRPYLRQIGLADHSLFRDDTGEPCPVVCSSEFFVLRSRDGHSIAFLVPFLLTPSVQRVFAASVEGGHHPRFGSDVLLGLPIPTELLEMRGSVSNAVEQAIAHLRDGEATLLGNVHIAEGTISSRPSEAPGHSNTSSPAPPAPRVGG